MSFLNLVYFGILPRRQAPANGELVAKVRHVAITTKPKAKVELFGYSTEHVRCAFRIFFKGCFTYENHWLSSLKLNHVFVYLVLCEFEEFRSERRIGVFFVGGTNAAQVHPALLRSRNTPHLRTVSIAS